MDNHPIPQDVTGFQFKLIGNMTVKQFGYVMCGVIMAVILYYLPLHSVFGVLLKTIFIPLIGGSGFLVAFVPIEGRPFDVMFGNFIRAFFTQNQFVYQKTGRLFSFSSLEVSKPTIQKTHSQAQTTTNTDKTKQLQQYLTSSHMQKQNALDMKEATFLQSFSSSAQSVAQPIQQPQPALQTQPVPQPAPIQQPPVLSQMPQQPDQTRNMLAQQEQILNQQLQEAKKDELQEIQQARGATSEAHQKALMLERQVQTLHFQRQQLEEQLAYLQKQLAAQKSPTPATTQAPTLATATTTTPHTASNIATAAPLLVPAAPQQQPVQQNVAKKVGLPHTPDTPNVIAGVVRDPRGNVLPNILVEVKDKDGNPVRAFKTNTLGQFMSATPLTQGNYTVELEDPKKQNTFAIIQLAATNQILLPIEIVSHDAREELRKQLFN